MKRASLVKVLRNALLIGTSLVFGGWLTRLIVVNSGMMPYWMDISIRYILEALGHEEPIDPRDIIDVSILLTFLTCWIGVLALMRAFWACSISLKRIVKSKIDSH